MKRGICCILCAVVLLTSLGLPIQAAETQTATYVLPRQMPEGLSWGYTERYFEFAKGDPEPR